MYKLSVLAFFFPLLDLHCKEKNGADGAKGADCTAKAKKYWQVKLKTNAAGDEYEFDVSHEATCKSSADLDKATNEYVMCCDDNKKIYIGQYTGTGKKSSYHTAEHICKLAEPETTDKIVSLCDDQKLGNLIQTSVGVGALAATGTTLEYQNDAKRKFPNNMKKPDIAAITTATEVDVWTSIECQ